MIDALFRERCDVILQAFGFALGVRVWRIRRIPYTGCIFVHDFHRQLPLSPSL